MFIDDIDRLDKHEIIEVVRLIRNTANFHNTFFLVAYDRDYVINALGHLNEHNHHQFLEKIFQMELNLPAYDKSILTKELYNRLLNHIPEKHQKELKDAILGSNAPISPEHGYLTK